MGIISLAVRGGICIYAVKYTKDQGVWGDAEKAIAFKNRTCEAVNGNEYIQTGKLHFQTYVPLPEVSRNVAVIDDYQLLNPHLILASSTSGQI